MIGIRPHAECSGTRRHGNNMTNCCQPAWSCDHYRKLLKVVLHALGAGKLNKHGNLQLTIRLKSWLAACHLFLTIASMPSAMRHLPSGLMPSIFHVWEPEDRVQLSWMLQRIWLSIFNRVGHVISQMLWGLPWANLDSLGNAIRHAKVWPSRWFYLSRKLTSVCPEEVTVFSYQQEFWFSDWQA